MGRYLDLTRRSFQGPVGLPNYEINEIRVEPAGDPYSERLQAALASRKYEINEKRRNKPPHDGWTNYETWNAALWMDNEESSQNYWREIAEEIYAETKPIPSDADKSFTREERAALDLRERLKDEFTETRPDLGATMWADLLNAAMSEINWYEIAEHYIADVDKETEETDKV